MGVRYWRQVERGQGSLPSFLVMNRSRCGRKWRLDEERMGKGALLSELSPGNLTHTAVTLTPVTFLRARDHGEPNRISGASDKEDNGLWNS